MKWFDHLHHAVRELVRAPALFLIIVLTFAITIGANTAIFSVVDAVLLRSLPVEDPEELFFVSRAFANPGQTLGPGPVITFSHQNYEEFLARTAEVADLAAFIDPQRMATSYGGRQPGIAEGQFVSGRFFDVLGINAPEGRTLTPDDDSGLAPVVLLSHRYWRESLGGDPAAVGNRLTVNGTPLTIAGILPRGFYGLLPGAWPDLYLPLTLAPPLTRAADIDALQLRLIGRGADGVAPLQATAVFQSVYDGILEDRVREDLSLSPADREAILSRRVALLPGAKGIYSNRDRVFSPLIALAVVVGLTLVIACVNVAIMMLARSLERRREYAIQLSIGATRMTLARKLVLQGVILGVAGGCAGAVLAYWGIGVLMPLLAVSADPIRIPIEPDLRVLAFIATISIAIGIASSFIPLTFVSRTRVIEALKAAGPRSGGRRSLAGRALLAAQVFACLLMLIVSGLFIRSLDALTEVDLGLAPEGLLLASIDPTLAGYREGQVSNFYENVYDRVRGIPGVETASMAAWSPMGAIRSITQAAVPDSGGPYENVLVSVNWVGPRYFQTVGTPILEGRDFTIDDARTTPLVAIVNRRLRDEVFGGESPMGRPLDLNYVTQDGRTVIVVGVVEDSKYARVPEEITPTIYTPVLQDPRLSRMTFVVRTGAEDPRGLAPALEREIRALDPNLPVFDVKTVTEQIDQTLIQNRLIATLSGLFAVVGLFLVCLGIYGLLSYEVRARRHEIGVRLALGQKPERIFTGFLARTFLVAAAGIVAAIAVALAVGGWIESVIYGIGPHDPVTIATAIGIMLLAALASATIPARRASTTPAAALLKEE